MRRRFLLIDNRLAGRGRTDKVEAVVERIWSAGAHIHRCAGANEAEALQAAHKAIRDGTCDAVIAAGGDGTIRLAAKAVAGTTIPLGAIPLGTGNVLAHELSWPRDPKELARLLLDGTATRIYTATANGELFLLMAGVGIDGRIIAALDHRLKNRIGKLAYAGPSWRAFRLHPDRLNITLDGQSAEAVWVIVTNASRYGGAFVLAPGTSVLRPGLQAVLFNGRSTVERMRELLALARGSLADLAGSSSSTVTIRDCSRVTIASSRPVPAQLDGDAFGTTPLEIIDGGPSVWLLLPQSPAASALPRTQPCNAQV